MYKTNSRKELRRNCSPIGHNIIQSIFCAQSGAGICLNFWKSFGESRYPGALPPLLENFRLAFSPDSTDCPWVSEDGEAMEVYLRVLKESNKSKFDGYHVRNSVYPILPFGIVACTFSRTTFLEIAVYTVNRYIFDWNKLGWMLYLKFHVNYYSSDMKCSSQLNVPLFQSLDEKMNLHNFAPCKYIANMWKLRSKYGAMMVNATLAY